MVFVRSDDWRVNIDWPILRIVENEPLDETFELLYSTANRYQEPVDC